VSRIVFFIEQIARGLYLVCAVGLLFSIRAYFNSRHELRLAEFELERELALRHRANAITWTFVIIEIALMVYAVANIIAPTMRADLVSGGIINAGGSSGSSGFQTSTPGIAGVNDQGTPVGDVNSLMLTVTADALLGQGGPNVFASPTPAPTAVGTIVLGMPTPVGCTTPDAQLEVPANGQVLFDSVEVRGVAKTENFAFYRFELKGPSTNDNFAPVEGDKTVAVPERGVLGQIALRPFQTGQYEFRLVVFDNKNTVKASCAVTVMIRERPPTPSPLPQQ
jgi:hypothetical protein